MFISDVPKNIEDFLNLIELERRLFGELALTIESAKRIFEFCPEIYSAIYDESGSIVAYSSAFPLKPKYASDFISGVICERDLEPEMLIEVKSLIEKSSIYIGSVVVANGFDLLTRSILLSSLLSWRLTQMNRLALSRLPIFMVAASTEGEQMIRFVGAKRLNDGSGRKDGKPVYGRMIAPGFIARATRSLGRCATGRRVEMRFERCHSASVEA